MKKFIFFIVFIFPLSLFSQSIVWDFEGQTTSATVPSGIGMSAGDAVFGSGLSNVSFVAGNGSGDAYQASNWSTSASRNSNNYIEVCITANAGYDKVINSIGFDEKRSGNGPQNLDITYNIDGGSETLLATDNIGNASWNSFSHSVNITLSSGSTICFRIYGYNAKKTNEDLAFDNIAIDVGGTLGIGIIDFNVKKYNNFSSLLWLSNSESNTDYFSVEWSRDGKNFEEIAMVESKGSQKGNQEYSYIHTNPVKGTNYYRLTQFDMEGRSQTFDVVSVYFDMEGQVMLIAPNKVINNLKIEFGQPVEKASLLIYDMEGQIIENSKLTSRMDILNLDVSGIVPGQYIVKYIDVDGTLSKKFIKL